MGSMYDCWLRYDKCRGAAYLEEYKSFCSYIRGDESQPLINTAVGELKKAINSIIDINPKVIDKHIDLPYIFIGTLNEAQSVGVAVSDDIREDGFIIKKIENKLAIIGKNEKGALYGAFNLIRSMCSGKSLDETQVKESPRNSLRLLNHWDNMNGQIERGYAGKSIFFKDNRVVDDMSRIKDYARLLASIGINGVVINNVNVHEYETRLITDEFLPDVAKIADVFRDYGVKVYLSINFASPIEIGGLDTADPLDSRVSRWWKDTAARIYEYIPDFGGFLVKADSEFRPGPFTYGRDHAEGANMLAEALEPYGGLVLWRCFVYNCLMDWRDRKGDRAKAAYDNFKPLDGFFMDNVILQIKYGPMDFQVREPVSPLFGALKNTNTAMEFQITQEYTGQQKHLCYLMPLWKEVLDFDTHAAGKGSFVSKIVDGSIFKRKYGGIVGVANIGDSQCWTGHPLAQANFYAFGRVAWDPELSAKQVAEEWIKLTLGHDREIIDNVASMLLESRDIYEEYTVPLGVGWMVNPGHHYGPNVDGYEYSHWGTYHYADHKGIGVDRTVATGTGYAAQYAEPVAKMYEDINTCPDELLLFFHHVPYEHKLKSGKTVIQHIYDTHFEGVERAEGLKAKWMRLQHKIDPDIFELVLKKLDIQIEDAKEWRDVINTYFYRKSGIKDVHNRKIYE